MKKLAITIILIICSFNIFSQGDVQYNYVKVNKDLTVTRQIYFRGDTLGKYIDNLISGSSTTASNGVTKIGQDFQLGADLTKSTTISGAGWPIYFGSSLSKLSTFNVNTTGVITLTTDGTVSFVIDGIPWTFNGNTFTNTVTGEYFMTNEDVNTAIEALLPFMSFNFKYNFNSLIADSRPGIGSFRLNNATYSLVDEIYIDYYNSDSEDKSLFLEAVDTGSYITINSGSSDILYQLNGGVIDAGNYFKYEVEYIGNSGVISGLCTIDIELNNNTGSGGGTVDSLYSAYANKWLLNGDTIPDTTNFSINSDTANIVKTTIWETIWVDSVLSKEAAGSIEIGGGLANNVNVKSDEIIINAQAGALDLISSSSINIDGNFQITTLDNKEFSVSGDSISSEDGRIRVKTIIAGIGGFIGNLFGNKAVIDSLIVNGDTILGTYSAKTYIESESFNQLKLSDTTISTHVKNRIYVDSATQGLVFQDDISGNWNIGSEVGERYYNPSGSIITNGSVVRLDSCHIATNGHAYGSVFLAGNSTFDSTMVLGIATTDLPATGYGRVVFLGRINDLNLSGFSGSVYLGNNGVKIDTSPNPPNISVLLGTVIRQHATEGSMFFNPSLPDYSPRPTIAARFTEETVNVTNPGAGLYGLITNGTNDLFQPTIDVGFLLVGDSVQVLQSGEYAIDIAFSLYNSATQTDDYRTAIYVNGVIEFSMLRSVSNVSKGVNSYPISISLNAGDWVSFRIANLNTGIRNSVFNDGSINIIYLGEQQ